MLPPSACAAAWTAGSESVWFSKCRLSERAYITSDRAGSVLSSDPVDTVPYRLIRPPLLRALWPVPAAGADRVSMR